MSIIRDLLVNITADTGPLNDLNREMRQMNNLTSSGTSELNKMAKGSGLAGKAMKGAAIGVAAVGAAAVGVVAAVGAIGPELVKSAASASAMSAQFTSVFGDVQKDAQKLIDGLGKDFGMAPNRIKPAMTQMTSMFKGLGLDTKEAMTTASDAVTLTADAAAFYDKSFEDANAALNSFIKGNYEGGESIGLFGNETQLAAYAAKNGVAKFSELGEAQKQLMRMDFAKSMQESAGATGQAARESNSLENQLGNLKSAWEGIKVKFGTPILEPAVAGIQKLASWIQNVNTDSAVAMMTNIVEAAEGMAIKVEAVATSIPGLFSGTSSGLVDFQSAITKAFGEESGLKIINFFLAIKSGVDLAETYIGKAKGLVTGLFSAFQGDTRKSAGILSAIGLSADTIITVQNIASQIVEEVKFRFGVLKTVAQGVGEFFIAAFNYLAPIIIPALQTVLTFAGGIFKKIRDFWESDGQILMKAVSNVFKGIFAVIDFIMPAVLAIIRMVWGNIKGAITGALNIIMGAVKIFSGLFTGDFGKMWEGIKQLFFGAVEFVWNFMQLMFYGRILGGVKAFVLGFRTQIVNLWKGVVELFKGNVTRAERMIKVAWGRIYQETAKVFTNIWTFLKNTWNSIVSITKGVFTVIKLVFSTGWKFLMKVTSMVFRGIWTVIQTVFTTIVSGIRGAINLVRTVFTAGWGFITRSTTSAFNGIWNGIKAAMNLIRTVLVTVFNFYRNIFIGGWSYISQITSRTLAAIWSFIRGILSAIQAGFSAAWGIISRTTIAVFNGIWTFLTRSMNLIKNVFFGAINLIKNIFIAGWSFIARTTSAVFNGIWSFLRGLFNIIRGAFQGFINFVKNVMINGWSAISLTTSRTFSAIWNFLRTTFTRIRDFISGAVSSVLTKVRDTWSALRTSTSTVFRDVFNTIKTRFTNIVDAAKALPGRIGAGIGSMASKVKSGVTSVINTLATTLGKGVNGVIGGVNWVLGKIGVETNVPKWEIPQWANGTGKGSHPGGPALINDGRGSNSGQELIRTPDGKMGMFNGKNIIANLPKGTQVLSAIETRGALGEVPKYNKGTDLWEGTKNLASKAWQGTKAIGGKVADAAFSVFDYVKNPSKLLDLAMKTLGIGSPEGGNFVGNMAKGAFGKVKDGAIGFVKKKLDAFSAASSSGIALTGGNGGRFGAPFRLTSRPGPRNTGIAGASRMHKGWDWAAPVGTPIPSVSNGVVTRNSWHPLSGKFVEVRSGDKIHRYQHNSRNAVSVGQQVAKGQTVGYVGSTGVSSGPHLHYEVKKGFAKGTNGPLKKATTAWVGERGPELMHLNKGTEIFSNNESKSMTAGGYSPEVSSSGGGVHFNPQVTIQVQGNADAGSIDRLKKAMRDELEELYDRFNRQMAFSREG